MHAGKERTRPDFSYDVFLSHSSIDKTAARELAERLTHDGLRVWFDENEIQPGDPIGVKVEDGLEQSRTLLLLMSKNALSSDWVTLEQHSARFRDPVNRNLGFIPIRLDDAPIPKALNQFAYVDWRERSGNQYAKLVTRLRGDSSGVQFSSASPILSPNQRSRAFISLCLLIFAASAVGVMTGGPLLALTLGLAPLGLLVLLRRRVFARFSRHTRVRIGSLLFVYVTSAVYYVPSTTISSKLSLLFSSWGSALGLDSFPDPLSFNICVALLVLLVVVAVNGVLDSREISVPSYNPWAVRSSSLGRDFETSLQRYCTSLISELDRYDREVNWSDQELTPLEAEVETERSARLRPRIAADLVKAIRRDRESTVFLVLGDPGSGKSVSLRRLVRLLCRQAEDTGVVPVYVNLREYPTSEEITTDSLVRFVREMALRQTGRDGRAFLDTWYETFRKSGRLFFIIDSFDELPMVLDCDDRSESHKEISATFDRLFTQEIQTCRAVLASRHFRAPVGVRGTRLVIRPFSEYQIRRAMQTWLLGRGIDSNHYIRRLFRERPHLVPLLRNPFTAELIAEFARTSAGDKLPDNLFSVFEHYLSERFATDQAALAGLNVSPKELREGAAAIARRMYESADMGLEADVDRIKGLLGDSSGQKAAVILEALRYTRIARVGGQDRRRFSFVHRRFAEFFVIDGIRLTDDTPQVEAIPSDSRWRDCLVMYCGIAELPDRKRIAEYCWTVIAASRDDLAQGKILEARNAIHCSRFLADAFRSDFEAIESFRVPLGDVVTELIRSNDLLSAKLAVEMIPLVDAEHQQEVIELAIRTESRWVCETTLGSCRHLALLSEETLESIRAYLSSMPAEELLRRFADLRFSLSLSDAFRVLRRKLWVDLFEIVSLILAAIATLILEGKYFPIVVAPSAVIAVLASILFTLWRKVEDDSTQISHLLDLSIALRMFVAIGAMFITVRLSMGVSSWDLGFWPFDGSNWPKGILPTLAFMVVLLGWRPLFRLIQRGVARRRIAGKGLSFLKRVVGLTGKAIVVIALLGGLRWLFQRLWHEVPTPFKRVLTILGLVLVVVLNLVMAVVAVVFLVRIVSSLIREAIERRRLNREGFPSSVTSDAAYNTCLSYRSKRIRCLYFEGLRRRRVPLVGEITAPPKELSDTPAVGEELARLREQWYGLGT